MDPLISTNGLHTRWSVVNRSPRPWCFYTFDSTGGGAALGNVFGPDPTGEIHHSSGVGHAKTLITQRISGGLDVVGSRATCRARDNGRRMDLLRVCVAHSCHIICHMGFWEESARRGCRHLVFRSIAKETMLREPLGRRWCSRSGWKETWRARVDSCHTYDIYYDYDRKNI